MRGEQAFVLVVGGADTGRSPMVAALLRQALPDVEVRSAGVLSHEGERADDEVPLALEQLGVVLGDHRARPLDEDEVRDADVLLAVDRGTARVLQAHQSAAGRAVALSELAAMADVVDPHRMPLGLWIAAARDFQAQIKAALPGIRDRLPPAQPGRTAATVANPSPSAPPTAATGGAAADRAEPLARIDRLLETAQLLPEIVDWTRLRADVNERLQAIAGTAQGPMDMTPAAALMIGGLLAQRATMPAASLIERLRGLIRQLGEPLDAPALARLGGELAAWSGS